MKTPLNLTETKVLTINGENVKVSALPDEIINEVQTLDRMRQEYVDAAYKLEVLSLAIAAKTQQISAELKQTIEEKAKSVAAATQQSNNTASE